MTSFRPESPKREYTVTFIISSSSSRTPSDDPLLVTRLPLLIEAHNEQTLLTITAGLVDIAPDNRIRKGLISAPTWDSAISYLSAKPFEV